MKRAALSTIMSEGVCFLWTQWSCTSASRPRSHIVLALKASCHACLITGKNRHCHKLGRRETCIFQSSELLFASWKCCWYNIPLLAWKMCKWLDTPPETVQDEEGSSSTSAPTISLRVPRASERPDPRAYRCTSESGSDLSGSQTAAILLIGSIQWASIADWKSTITDVVVASCDKNLAVLQGCWISGLSTSTGTPHLQTFQINYSPVG